MSAAPLSLVLQFISRRYRPFFKNCWPFVNTWHLPPLLLTILWARTTASGFRYFSDLLSICRSMRGNCKQKWFKCPSTQKADRTLLSMVRPIPLSSEWGFGWVTRIMCRVVLSLSFIVIWKRQSIHTFKAFPLCCITAECLNIHNGIVFVWTIPFVGWTTIATCSGFVFQCPLEMVRPIR